jgi:uncharacterized cupin superfamily protein
MSQPIIFAAPADIDLNPNPIHPDWVIEGKPQARAKCLAQSADRTASVMAWSCTPGRFEWYYAVDETVHIIAGEVFVTDEKGEIHRLGPGDMAFFPAGSHCTWQVTKEVRKLAVCRHGMPRPLGFVLRAWNKIINRLTGFPTGNGLATAGRSASRSHALRPQGPGVGLGAASLTSRRSVLNQPPKGGIFL